MLYFVFYFALISVISICTCISDKRRAIKHAWRIKESTLFLLSVMGGGIAMYITMRIIHHKTHHRRFMFGIPLIIFAQIAVILFLYSYIK